MKKRILDKIRKSRFDNIDNWINEALFGYDQIKKYLNLLNPNDTVLEVGCGSGILLSLINENYRYINLLGVEPIAKGFEELRELNTLNKKDGLEIQNIKFEEIETFKRFNLIFCINVFEHIDDWKKFLIKAKYLLKKDGKLIILCPNYGFPYESHFGIPIIINKKFTYLIFQSYIKKFQFKNSLGIWKSLNFVTKKEIKKYLQNDEHFRDFKMIDHKQIIDDMIERSLKDIKFRKRQNFNASIGILLRKTGIIKFFLLFPDFLPYMKLELFFED